MPFIIVLLLGGVVGAAISETLRKWVNQSLEAIANWLYRKFAGTPLFENIALKKYRQALIDKYQKLNIPFRPNRPLEMRKVYVPLKVSGTSDRSLIEAKDAVQQDRRLMVNRVFRQGRKPEEAIESDLNWIWEPFETSGNLGFSARVKKIASGIVESSPNDIPTIALELDPRLVIPLCAIELQDEINISILQSDKILTSAANEAKNTTGGQQKAQFIDKVLSAIEPTPRWQYLFSGLTPALQFDLIYRLINYRLPNIGDWRNIFKEVKYEFKNSWHYRLVIVLVILVSNFQENWIQGLIYDQSDQCYHMVWLS